MADQRSVMKEYRLLEQKRQAGGLSHQEEARLAQLRNLVGPETGAGLAKPGFDVNAAAAKLRESLLPAGLRNRPPQMPEAAPEPPPETAPEPQPAATGLEAEWNAAPFAPLTEPAGLSADALFDPGTLGEEPAAAEPAAWDANAQPYDAGAQAWDPNAQPYDAGAQAWDPNAQPYDPSQPYDPNQPYDAGAQAWDPSAQPYDPNAQPYDAGAQAWDPNAQPYDPSAPAQKWDPSAAAQWDEAVQPAMDPNLAAPWSDEVAAPEAAPAEWDAGAVPAEAAPGDRHGTVGCERRPIGALRGEPRGRGRLGSGPRPGGAPACGGARRRAAERRRTGDRRRATGGRGVRVRRAGDHRTRALAAAEFAESEAAEPEAAAPAFDAPESPVEELLPFDAAAASVIAPDAAPEGWGQEPTASDEGAAPAEEPGAYGDLSGNEPVAQTDALPAEEAQGLVAPLGDGQELTSEDDAFAQGFHLESNGSFGKAGATADPAWSAPAPAAEAESWESAPALDLGAMSPASDVPPIDLDPGAVALVPEPVKAAAPRAPAHPVIVAPPPEPDALDEIDVEEIPVVEGEELLEELPPAPAAPTAVRVEGMHRVVVHTVEGLVKRGAITDARLDAPTLPLAPQPGAAPEALATAKVKAIFFMLSPGEQAPSPTGKKVRVTFTDGRQIAGFSPDYSETGRAST